MQFVEDVTVACCVLIVLVYAAHEVIAIKGGRPQETLTVWLHKHDIIALFVGIATGLLIAYFWGELGAPA